MTADHWIQVAAIIAGIITPFAVVIWGPVLASRINQPTVKLETAKPDNTSRIARTLKRPWFLPALSILVSIVSLHKELQVVKVTPHQVLWVAIDTSSIVLAIACSIALNAFRILLGMNQMDGDLLRLIEKIAGEAENEQGDTPQT